MFNYSPQRAIKVGNDGEGHFRPDPKNQTWLIDSVTGKSYTSEQCQSRVEELAQSFYHHLKLRQGEIVVIYSPNEIDYPIVIWATLRAGGIVSGANPSYTVQELSYQLTSLAKHFTIAGLVTNPESLRVASKAASSIGLGLDKILLMSSQLSSSRSLSSALDFEKGTKLNTIDEIIERNNSLSLEPINFNQKLRPGENKRKVAFLSFSSGTTGLPKAVCISHHSVISNIIMITKHDDCDFTGHRTLSVLPYYHIFGYLIILHAGIYRNLTNVVIPKFNFENYLKFIIKYRPSILYLVPPMVVLLTKSKIDEKIIFEIGKTVKTVVSGAAPLRNEIVCGFKKRYSNTRLNQLYGMTELSVQVTGTPNLIVSDNDELSSSAGVLLPNVSIKIISLEDKKKHLGFNQVGEIYVKSPSNAMGYLGNPKATAETFGSDGFLLTGDQGYIDQNGWLFVVERLKELIKVKGNQVAPAELEGLLLGHESVNDACVIGIEDDYSGELPRAYIVRSEIGLKEDPLKLKDNIKKFVAQNKVRYKWLDGGIEFVDFIPKNPSGKILRRELRQKYKNDSKKDDNLFKASL
ncbi:hypothetical protein BY996DRAFT_4575438 [Phakopsora pachyrhizi]|uniref:Uncharacterized protein n=1 Tax=Phakopsora pachyrhizi TaxID=170000 RepID=A0AAV0BDT8_PHAPC|nr:hypothetical protein BY996DRAFT_4575438 [Phakopsora pachyrhizi]CAH7684055.1 hypothetical protein PPACK8108_LOCUS17999 [Phakopsora pachyrhizi]